MLAPSFFLHIQVQKAEVRPAQLGWLTSSLGDMPGGLVTKAFHGPLSTSPVRGAMPHAMGEWGCGGRGREVRTLLFSPISTSQPELDQRPSDFSSFHSPPFPKSARVPIPRPLPGLKNWDTQATNAHQDRLPLYSKKGLFYFVSFLANSSDVLFITSHLEQCWPPCIH